MKHSFLILPLLVLLFLTGAAKGAGIPGDLQELGRGQVYYLKFIKVYDAILYGEQRAGDGGILGADISKCLHLVYAVDIAREDFIKAAETVLARQYGEGIPAAVKGEIDTLHDNYRDVNEGDSYTLCYDSSLAETTLSYNGDLLVGISSPEFSRTYFNIWLGSDAPLDDKLRDNLLAGYQPEDSPSGDM